jgi:putative ABC transport system permease protein
VAWLIAGLRRWREDWAASLLVAVLVLASALVFALAPRLLDRVDHAALRSTVEALSQDARGIELLQAGRFATSTSDPLAGVVATGADLEAPMPASVRGLVRARTVVVDTPRFLAERKDGATIAIATLRIQPGALAHVRITSGRAPAAGSRTITDPASGHQLAVYEVAVSEATASRMDVGLGDTVPLEPDAHDPLAIRSPTPAAAEIVGIFQVPDPADPFWFGDTSLATPGIRSYSPELTFVDATLLLSPEAYPRLLESTPDAFPFQATWRLDVDPARVTAASPDALLGDLRRLSTLFPAASEPSGVEVRTQLTLAVAGHVARWRSASQILAVAAVGTAAVGIAALALVALLAARRRRGTIAAWTARGASRAQILAASGTEAAIVVVPPALLALGLALVLVPDAGPAITSAVLCLLVAAATAALLVGADASMMGGAADAAPPATRGGRRSRRAAVEAMVVVLALVGAFLIRQRAAPGTAAATGSLDGPDPFIAAVPALVGIAAGLVAARLFRLPMRALGSVAARRRGLVPLLALRRSSRGGIAAAMLLVLMAMTTVATFGAATLAHVDRAAAAIAWQEVGADLHVTAPDSSIPAGSHLSAAPGVAAVADIYRATVPLGIHGASVELLAVDPAALERVTAGTPADLGVAADLSASPGGSLPAIVSSGLTDGLGGVGVGGTFDLGFGGQHPTFTAVAALDTFPTIPLDTSAFVIVSRPLLEASIGGAFSTTDALVRAPGVTAAALRAAIAPDLPGVVVDGRAETEAAVRHSPIVDGAATGIVLATLMAAAYAAIALIAALALASAARAAETAHLRTLGLSGRQSAGLVVLEFLPAALVAFVVGAILGVATFALAEPGLGLDALLGSPLSVPLGVEPAQLVALLAATAILVAASVAIGAALERSAAMSTSVRRGLL